MKKVPDFTPRMAASDFSAWVNLMRNDFRWSKSDCARRLGSGINQIRYWMRDGAPAYISLACSAIRADLDPWTAAKPGYDRTIERTASTIQALRDAMAKHFPPAS